MFLSPVLAVRLSAWAVVWLAGGAFQQPGATLPHSTLPL
jgi:hypothetical protein